MAEIIYYCPEHGRISKSQVKNGKCKKCGKQVTGVKKNPL